MNPFPPVHSWLSHVHAVKYVMNICEYMLPLICTVGFINKLCERH